MTDDTDFDRLLIASAFELAASRGWPEVSVAEAARSAGLDLGRARSRFPGRAAVLMRFGVLADQAALEGASTEDAAHGPTVRERLFDMLMRRIDMLQAHRAGMLALLRGLRADPGSALLLAMLTRRSMAWLLDAAGGEAGGMLGAVRTKGLLAVWLYTVRAWQSDESPDLPATMAALDKALARAEQAANWRPGLRTAAAPGPVAEPDMSAPIIEPGPPPPPPSTGTWPDDPTGSPPPPPME